MKDWQTLTADVETSIFNKGNPFDKRNICVTIHTKLGHDKTVCKRYTEPDFVSVYKSQYRNVDILVGHNVKFDIHWLLNLGIQPNPDVAVWDTMLAEFVLSGQCNSFVSLNQLAEYYGLSLKIDKVKEYWDSGVSTEDIPPEIVEEYGNYDVDLTHQVYLHQLDDPRMTEKIRSLILLQGQDLLVLQEMEYKGLKFNKEKAIEKAKDARSMIDLLEIDLLSYADIKELNFDSDDQLSAYLYGGSFTKELYQPVTSITKSGPNKGKERTINRKIGEEVTKLDGFFDPLPNTALKKEGLYSSAGDALKQLKAPTKLQKLIVQKLLKRADLIKLTGTYYEGLTKLAEEMHWEDTIHGQYNQVVVRTGRLSSSKPNMQNNPIESDELFESRYD